MKKVVLIAALSVGSSLAFAQNIQFYNYIFSGGPLAAGLTPSVTSGALANAITFNTPNAVVGDPVAPLRSGSLSIQYDAATTTGGIYANQVGVNLGGVILGSGTITFREDVFEIDALGNELRFLGSASHVFNAGPLVSWNTTITFTGAPVLRMRAKKYFDFAAPDTAVLDLASLSFVNQAPQVVPEPASMTALALGAAALLRRKRKS